MAPNIENDNDNYEKLTGRMVLLQTKFESEIIALEELIDIASKYA